MEYSKEVRIILDNMMKYANTYKHEYITPEHLLYSMTFNENFLKCYTDCHGNVEELRDNLHEFLQDNIDKNKTEGSLKISYSLNELLKASGVKALNSSREVIQITHIVDAMTDLEDSYALYYITSQGVDLGELLYALCDVYRDNNSPKPENKKEEKENNEQEFLKYVEVLNDSCKNYPPLVGREKELERTIQILCRKNKNNPLHIGEPGVGKTAITIGLARLINDNKVPEKLKNAKVYSLDLSSLIAGTQYRGDFEKRFKLVLQSIEKEGNAIIYIDEIHNIVGAGATGNSSFDASNMLKPYLADGKIKFIGATTYDEYKKNFSKSKSLVRRFQNIDVNEPSIEESIEILKGIKEYYEEFHNVTYSDDVIEYAVNLSSKYINERYLPDKAIDLLDEAGAYRAIHKKNKKKQIVDKKLIEEVISSTCNIPKKTIEGDEVKKLSKLSNEIKSKVFGQDEAVNEVVNSIKLSRVGLIDENKPIASLLFVGPTGVGKTEIAKVTANILDLKLIRFDMSEYAEKHTIAKLIGSPAGYVGYEEGGLLTEAIRKNPHSVLLLDEIEKAHSDIYNILLQIMDYATLTDNQGRKADFRNVLIIMTSNAGARNIGKNVIGFGERKISKEGINDEVKRVFSPEFRNRLNKVIVFNDLDKEMAGKIVTKEISALKTLLKKKNVQFTISNACRNILKEKGLTKEYGAREIVRLIQNEIKPLFIDEILFGKLKEGGKCKIDYKDDKFYIC